MLGLITDALAPQVDYNITQLDLFLDLLEVSGDMIPIDEIESAARTLQISFENVEGLSMLYGADKRCSPQMTQRYQVRSLAKGDVMFTRNTDQRSRRLHNCPQWTTVNKDKRDLIKHYARGLAETRVCHCSSCTQCCTAKPWSNRKACRWHSSFELFRNASVELADFIRDGAQLLLEFQDGQYSATVILELENYYQLPYDNVVVFCDPYYRQWKYSQQMLGSDNGLERMVIDMPPISMFLLLAHIFPTNGRLDCGTDQMKPTLPSISESGEIQI